ncbi:MAG: tetratricopeptide repeat protein [Chloroflexi bacterium]|nr:MAG: tetratricopeptide repeat protein [Chloroflexota bacterium]
MDTLVFDKAVAALRAYSLIRRDSLKKMLSVHRLVQAVLKDAMDEQTKELWAMRVVLVMSVVFPAVEFTDWSLCERYLPQVLACAGLIEQENQIGDDGRDLRTHAARYLYDCTRYCEALPLLQQVHSINERKLGTTHPKTANSLNNLAILYREQGMYEEAETLLKRAWAIDERAYGPDHPRVVAHLRMLIRSKL